ELNTSRNDITNGFQLSFKGPSPDVAQHVAADLASKFINEQTTLSSQGAYQQLQFMDAQVRQAKEDLDAVDKQRLEYMTTHISSLPSSSQALVQQLSGLYEQQKAIVAEIGRLRDQQTMLSTQLAAAQKNRQFEDINVARDITDPKTTIAWGDLVKQESDLESQIESMRAGGLRAKNPDVVAKQKELEGVQKRKQLMLDDWKEKTEERKRQLAERVPTEITTYQTQLEFAKGEIARQQKFLDETRAQIGQLETRINGVPNVEVGLGALDRDYQTKKTTYDELLEKRNKAAIALEATKAAQGESIALIDPASLPEKPVAPKRPQLMILGLLLGLGVGLCFAAAFEVPRLLTVQTVEDARHYTSLPVLVSVPELLTPREVRRRKTRRFALAFASAAVTVFAVPALALLLKLSHVFERIGT
ncbi:MAG: hypothetical protein M3268_00335, partial [Acidobacteriota bacterium]|nr:hypothetical protein [Acidobacteriota bacterium]